MTQSSSKDLQNELDNLNKKIEDKNRNASYKKATKLRERGVLGNITDNLIAGNSVGGSIKSGISDTFKAKMTGLKEKFDPISIAKTISGNLGAAVVGKLTSRSAGDISHFTGIKSSKGDDNKVGSVDTAFYTTVAKGNRLRRGDSISDVVTKMFSFVKTSREEEIKQYELNKDFDKTKHEKDKERHEQLLEAIEESKSREIPEKMEKPKEEPRKSETTTPTEPPKPSTAKPVEAPKPTVKPTVKPVEAEAPIAPPKTTSSVSQTVVQKAKEIITPSAVSTAAKVAIGVTAAVTPTTLGDLIAKKGESGKAGYNAANMGTKGGKIQGLKQPVNLEQLTVGEVMERQAIKWGSKDEDKKLFAVGKYQVIPGTLKDAVTALGISKSDPFDAKTQERIFNDYLLKVRKPSLQDYLVSKEDDPVLLKKAIHELSLEWASIADPNIPGGTTSHYGSGNKASIFVSEMEKTLRLEREKNNRTTAAPTTSSSGIGERLTKSSVQNQELTETTPSNLVVVNNSVTAISGGVVNKQIMSTPPKDIKPTYMAN